MRKLSRRQNENLTKIKNVVHSSLEEAINLNFKLLKEFQLISIF